MLVTEEGLVRNTDRWLLRSMMMIFDNQKSQITNPHAMGIYSGGSTEMVIQIKWWVMEMLLTAVFFSNLWN